MESIEEKIGIFCANKNKLIVDDYLGKKEDTIEGYSQAKTWQLTKKLCPKNIIEPPCAKKDGNGDLVTEKEALEKLYVDTYTNRLKPNEIKQDYVELKSMKKYLFEINHKTAEAKQSKDWVMKDLENSLKTLKNNKSRDEHGLTYELFKYGGRDLKLSLLKLFNRVKQTQTYPTIFRASNISSIWKKKGERSNLDNDRGIFCVSKIRSILDKLIYNDYYDTIDVSMSSSNIGGRKSRNIRDHLFVINGIMNDVTNNKEAEDIDIEIYDVAKCFDKLEYFNTANDFYKAGVKDDKFIVVANSNKNCNVAIKMPWGTKTERTKLENIEMQGTVLAGIKCAISIDNIGKEALENEHDILYDYKNCVKIPPLSFIDDILTVSKCGEKSIKINAVIQAKVENMQLELGQNKCFQMHVGKLKNSCSKLSIHGNEMQRTQKEKYLGNILTSNAKLDENILARCNKSIGIINEIMGTLKEVSFGHYYFEIGLLFRNSKLINGMLCSVEALYGLNITHIEKLEKCDHDFFRHLFKSGAGTPIESFYLSTNTLPIRHVIIGRRLMFLWTILQKSESDLVKKCLNAQLISPAKNDLATTFKNDLEKCGITLTMIEISKMKKSKFRKIVNSQIRELAKEHLVNLKMKHSKLENISDCYRMEKYLTSSCISTDEKQTLFKFRTRMIEVKSNFKYQFSQDLKCYFCLNEDTQSHVLSCREITKDIDISEVKYEHIFSDSLNKQEKVAKVLNKIMKQRNMKIRLMSTNKNFSQ